MSYRKKLARDYAVKTAGTRCPGMGHDDQCDECRVRFCDYRSRKDGFYAGLRAAESVVEDK